MENLEETRPESKDQQGKAAGDGNELSAVEQHIRIISKTLRQRGREEYNGAKEQVGEYLTQLKQEEGITDESELDKKQTNYLREARKVDAVTCLFNPKSFTQTVENIFHFSFAVKEGKAEIKTRGFKEAEEYGLEPGPMAVAIPDGVEKPLPKQAIVSLSMRVSFLFALLFLSDFQLRRSAKFLLIACIHAIVSQDWRDMCAAYSVEESDVPHRKVETPAKKRARTS